MMCVNRDCTVYFNAHTQYGMYTTHCIIWYLAEAVELMEVPIPYKFQNSKIYDNEQKKWSIVCVTT